MPSKLLPLVLLLAGANASWAQAQAPPQKQPFTVETMLKLARISEPVLSPDGLQVAYTVQTVDVTNNTKPTQIYTIPTAGGNPEAADPGRYGERTSALVAGFEAYLLCFQQKVGRPKFGS